RSFQRLPSEAFGIKPERVASLITPKTRAIVITSLHNPTSLRTSPETIRELARIAEAQGAYVLVDEVYAPFVGDSPLQGDSSQGGIFMRSARKIARNVVTVASLTKCYGLGMYRIGWVLGPPEIVERAMTASIATFGHLPLSHASIAVSAFS